MGLAEILITAVGLAMDAFAVSVSKGLSMKKINYRAGLMIALFFGIFQSVMPLLGWFLAVRFETYITAVDHWIAFGLLVAIGTKAIIEAVREMKKTEEEETEYVFKWGELLLLSIATSIDALAVGISFAFLRVNI